MTAPGVRPGVLFGGLAGGRTGGEQLEPPPPDGEAWSSSSRARTDVMNSSILILSDRLSLAAVDPASASTRSRTLVRWARRDATAAALAAASVPANSLSNSSAGSVMLGRALPSRQEIARAKLQSTPSQRPFCPWTPICSEGKRG